MRLSKRETVLLIALGVVLILVLGINFLIVPMSNEVREAKAVLLEKNDEVALTNMNVQLAGEMSQALKNVYAKTEELKKPYENSLKQEEVDLWLNDMLAKNGLEIQNMEISNIQIATANFDSAALGQEENLPIQDAADVVNGVAEPSAQPTEGTADGEAVAETIVQPEAAATQGTEAGTLYQINVVINCRGLFDNVIAFANDLYASGRALRITTLETQQTGEDGKTSAVVIVEFYGIPTVETVGQTGTGDAK